MKLLEGEEIRLVLGSKHGIAQSTPLGEDYLLLTSQRVIATWREETRRRQVAAPLGKVDGIELTEMSRETGPLVTGAALMLAGVMVLPVAELFSLNGVVAWLLAWVLVVLGAVTASAYFVREQAAVITFRAGVLEAALPLRSAQAVLGAYAAAFEFFALAGAASTPKAGPYSTQPPTGAPFRWSKDREGAGVAAQTSALSAPNPEARE